ncbi:hypothetical protein EKO27_g8458 [Xylaria grammica]|uniref:HMG box domain-containing protein n=1 Tax=Xylaria grammica TaxID=363999 RepID=A0A439CWQ3_9PEZI|nr:hypothetical protein EKO27_g8458 [Xylaria grammica]
MENIDPRLLAHDAAMQLDHSLDHAEPKQIKEEQADIEFFPEFLSDNDLPPYYSDPDLTVPYQFDLASAYPEEPLVAREDGFQHYFGPPLTYTGEPSTAPGPEYGASYYPHPVPSQWFPTSYQDSSTQTEGPGRVAPAPAPAPGSGTSSRRPLQATAAKGQEIHDPKQHQQHQRNKVTEDGQGSPAPNSASLPYIQEVDINAFVRRGADDRILKGQITRPVNAFILYRRAYLAQAEALAGTNHNAELSRALGASWRMESEGVKARFHGYAQIERAVHAQLFPHYVFKPGKRVPVHMEGAESDMND